jgi:hypothetical protein
MGLSIERVITLLPEVKMSLVTLMEVRTGRGGRDTSFVHVLFDLRLERVPSPAIM